MYTTRILICCLLFTTAVKSNQEVSSTSTTDTSSSNIWFLSDDGSDENDCGTESTPCQHLQTVLNRASDGADIYVTSDTLSLDLVHENRGDMEGPGIDLCCIVISHISYNLSSYNDTPVNITCSERFIVWEQRDKIERTKNTEQNAEQNTEQKMPQLHMKHCVFYQMKVTFHLWGIATFDNCSMYLGFLSFVLHKSQYEESPSLDDLANVFLYVKKNSVRFIRTELEEKSIVGLVIEVLDAVRTVHISQSYIKTQTKVYIGSESQHAALYLLIEDSSVVNENIFLETNTQNSLGYLSLRNVVFHNSYVKTYNNNGAVAVKAENCTFTRGRFYCRDLVYLSVQHSHFHIDGGNYKGVSVGDPSDNEVSKRLLYYFGLDEPTVIVEHVTVHGSYGRNIGGAIYCSQFTLIISNCVFSMTPQSTPPPRAGFIYYYSTELNLTAQNVILDARQFTQ